MTTPLLTVDEVPESASDGAIRLDVRGEPDDQVEQDLVAWLLSLPDPEEN